MVVRLRGGSRGVAVLLLQVVINIYNGDFPANAVRYVSAATLSAMCLQLKGNIIQGVGVVCNARVYNLLQYNYRIQQCRIQQFFHYYSSNVVYPINCARAFVYLLFCAGFKLEHRNFGADGSCVACSRTTAGAHATAWSRHPMHRRQQSCLPPELPVQHETKAAPVPATSSVDGARVGVSARTSAASACAASASAGTRKAKGRRRGRLTARSLKKSGNNDNSRSVRLCTVSTTCGRPICFGPTAMLHAIK